MNISSLYNGLLTNASIPGNDTVAKPANSSGDIGFSFKDMISNELEKLNNAQIKADELTQGFISGQVEDLHTVLIAAEEARLSLELAVQVRNKCVEAYKEINNMQL